jgi:hypothetical protein
LHSPKASSARFRRSLAASKLFLRESDSISDPPLDLTPASRLELFSETTASRAF